MTADNDRRYQGIEIGPLADSLESIEFPIEKDQLLEKHGDVEIDFVEGSQQLADVLEPVESAEFESAEDVIELVVGTVENAVGRDQYSDRGSDPDTEHTDQSL